MYALVTGASAGIGMEIAKYLAVKGYDLILTARREDRLEKLRKQIITRYPDRSVIVIPADLSKREECVRLFTEACEKAGIDPYPETEPEATQTPAPADVTPGPEAEPTPEPTANPFLVTEDEQ